MPPSMHVMSLLQAGQVCVCPVCVCCVPCALRGHFSNDPNFWRKHRSKDSQTTTELLRYPDVIYLLEGSFMITCV